MVGLPAKFQYLLLGKGIKNNLSLYIDQTTIEMILLKITIDDKRKFRNTFKKLIELLNLSCGYFK